MEKGQKLRNINIDIIKCIAVFLVVSVHFCLNNGFYSTPISCPRMYIMAGIRTFSMMCVPLFLLITGFLMYKKEFSAKFYVGLKRILIPYTIISVITLIVRVLSTNYLPQAELFGEINYINGFIDFNLIGYAWYVDMYLGLFLLIPFINKMLSNQKMDTVLLVTLIFLTALPTVCSRPTLIISKWVEIWPVTYYVIGAYIAKYVSRVNLKLFLSLFVFFMSLFIILNCLITNNNVWSVHDLDNWCGLENVITSTLFFICILNIKFNFSKKIETVISYIASLSLGIYLSSFIFDTIYYHYLNSHISNVTAKLEWYAAIVPLVFVSSIILAMFSDVIYRFIDNSILKKH